MSIFRRRKARTRTSSLTQFWEDALPEFLRAIAFAETKAQGKPGWQKLRIASRFVASRVDIPIVPEFMEVWLVQNVLTLLVALGNARWGHTQWYKTLLGNVPEALDEEIDPAVLDVAEGDE